MAVVALLTLALFAGSACSTFVSSRIVGGDPATVQEFPSIVQVEFQDAAAGTWSQNCGGSILNSIFVLSSAHCFDGLTYTTSRRRIRAGSSYRNTGGIVSAVNRAVNHPNYGLIDFDSDISVVRLSTQLQFNPEIQQASIVAPGFTMPDNIPVVQAGWGATAQAGPHSPVLRKTTVFTVNNDLCASRYQQAPVPIVVTSNMICAGLLDVGGRDACQGDSGGPMYLSNIVVGIISWGYGCANATFPGVSTAVSPFTPWIVANAR